VQVPPRDPRALADAIDRLLGDASERTRLGRAARATVERSFTWEICGRETVAAYERALAGRFPPPMRG
jgi:glycosyltransferase involved in cell wall biosynthesis